MHAFLIIGHSAQVREQTLASQLASRHISPWDIVRVPAEGSIGIEMVREWERALALTPVASKDKAGVLTDMERLTGDAQHALLKTIEEPPPHTYIIGTTGMPETLIATIRSRMVTVRPQDDTAPPENTDRSELRRLLAQSPGNRLRRLDPHTATRDDAKAYAAVLLAAAHAELVSASPDPAIQRPALVKLLRNLLTAVAQLSVNVNPKLVLDNAILRIV